MEIHAIVDVEGEPIEFLFDTRPIPIVTGINPDRSRQTATQLAGRTLRPADQCAHTGATWSANLALRCPQCGSPMFLPPHLLARLSASTLTAMHELWRAAGWPEWSQGGWRLASHWTVIAHPLFAHCGGLPVRNDLHARYNDAVLQFTDDVA